MHGPFHKKFQSYFKKGSSKEFPMSVRAYESVDEKSPILGYVPKNDEKKNSVHKGLKKVKIFKLH